MEKILDEIITNNYSRLSQKIFSEKKLKELANLINSSKDKKDILKNLLINLGDYKYSYDWNIGSLIQQ